MKGQQILQDLLVALRDEVRELENNLRKHHLNISQNTAQDLPCIGGKTLPEQLAAFLVQIDEMIKDPVVVLNLVFIGQFNSGKSSLINGLIGHPIATVEETEMTFTLNYITYGDTQGACIHYKDGRLEKSSIEGINEKLLSHRDDQAFRDSVESVEYSYPHAELENINIWDTPGLGSLSQDNKVRTNSIINDTDIVFWVIDATALGDFSDRTEIERVIRLNKPIIALVNKMDEIDAVDAKARVLDFLQEHYPDYFKRVFFVSAKRRWHAIVRGEESLDRDSGVGEVKTFLEQDVFRKKRILVLISFYNKMLRSVQSLQDLIDGFCDILEERQQKLEEFSQELVRRSADILPNLRTLAKDYVFAVVFEEEFAQLLNRLESNDAPITGEDALKRLLSSIFTKAALEKYIDDIKKHIENFMYESWVSVLGQSTESVKQSYTAFAIHRASSSSSHNHYGNSIMQLSAIDSDEYMVKGTLFGAGAGLAISGLTGMSALLMGVIGAIAGVLIAHNLLGRALQDKGIEVRSSLLKTLNDSRKSFYQDIVEAQLLPMVEANNIAFRERILQEAETKYLLFHPIAANHDMIKRLKRISLLLEQISARIDEEFKTMELEKSDFSYKHLIHEDFLILRSNPNPGIEMLKQLLSSARRYLFFSDPYFNCSSLKWLFNVDNQVSIKILLASLDEELEEHAEFTELLNRFRSERQAPVLVRVVKFRNRAKWPIHDRYIFSESWALSMGNGFDAIGKQDITCSFLSNPREFKKNTFEKYWNAMKIRYPNHDEDVLTYDL